MNRQDNSAANSSGNVRTRSLSVRAPAKINWFLHILQKREDGYHDIVSLMQCVSLYDELILEHADSIIVEGDMDIPVSDNLVFKAAALLKESVSYPQGARIILKKKIPLSAGLGGGSSDAASALSGLNRLWGLGFRHEELCSIGSRIGSDVPFFFHAPAAFAEGRGDRVTPLKGVPSITLLLVKPALNVSTAWAYQAFDKFRNDLNHGLTKKTVDIKLFCRALQKQDFPSLAHLLFNDLERVVTGEYPVVGDIKQKLSAMGAVAALMSGSGPTVFGVFTSRDKAEKAHAEMKPHWCSLVQTLTERRSTNSE